MTSSLEFIANPQMERWPNNAGARGCLDLQFYQGRLFNGGGEVESNPGAPWLHSINPYDLSYQFEYDPGTEAIANYLVTSWGDLVTPSQDPHEGDANIGHVFSRTPEGAWSRFSSVGGSLPAGSSKVSNNTHCWHMAEFDDRVFVACYNLLSSTNRFKTFEVCSPITSAYHRISYSSSFTKFFSKKTYQYSTINTLRRQVHLMQFGDRDLFAIGNTVVNPALWTNTNVNNQELYWYNRTTKQFEERSQHLSTIYPNLTTNDYRLVGRNLKLLATNECAYVWMRAWHPTTFKDRVLYIASYDTPPYASKVSPFEDTIAWTSYPLPLMGCSATVSTDHKISATRLNFGGDTENYPWDFAVAGDTVYTFTTKYNATTKLNRHIVWKSTDGVNFSEVLAFDFHQNMISLEYRDGWFYFGCGYKKATLGYSYDGTADESGAIYRVRCPQEPVEVIPSVGELTIAEGRSAQVSFRLSAAPTTNLTLRVGATRDNTRFTTDKSSLTFTTTNWSTPQTVTITLQDNDVIDVNRTGVVACGVAGFDVERGEFCGAEATSGSINLTADDDDITPPANGEIRTADDFYCAMSFPDGSYKLMNDIDLSGSLYTTIDEFSGSLDGNGHTIKGLGEGPFCKVSRGVLSNLTLDGEGTTVKSIAGGVFCNDLTGGAFTNVTLKGYAIKAGSPDTFFGLFAAQAIGRTAFVGCTVDASCSVNQAGSHDCSLGAYLGKIYAKTEPDVLVAFINCTNDAEIVGSDNYRTASGAGGFVGVISDCATADEPEIRFAGCVNNGAVTAKGRYAALGGFVGRHTGAGSKTATSLTSFTDCTNNGAFTALDVSAKENGSAGGFIGIVGNAANATFAGSVNRGTINAAALGYAGGFVGSFGDYAANVGVGGLEFINTANYADVASTNLVGGFVGSAKANANWGNGRFIFLNSANYGELQSSAGTKGEFAATITSSETAAGAVTTFSNCWTRTSALVASISKEAVVDGNQNATVANATALAALNAVAAAHADYQAWAVGATGYPELTTGEVGAEPGEDPGSDPEPPVILPAFTLTVVGEPSNLGEPTPAYGTHSVTQGVNVSVTVPVAYLNAAQTSKAVCLAWAAIANGDAFAYALKGSGSFTMPDADVTLAYNFAVSNRIDVTAGAHGSVTGGSTWHATNETVTVAATAAAGYAFAGWTGDVAGLDVASETLTFAATAPRALTANFARIIQPGEETAIFVSVDGNDDAAGTADEPFLTLSNAVARLGESGGRIFVGPGVFMTKDPVVVTAPVEIVGSGCGEDGTVLRNIGSYNFNSHPDCRVLDISNAVAMVRGLVVENGFVGIGSGNNGGGGIKLMAGVVSNCVIRGCAAKQGSSPMPFGGGVYVGGAEALLTHSVVSNCTSTFDASWGSVCGAGVHVANGGKVSNTLVTGCMAGTATPGYAKIVGGIMLTEGSAENCTVVGCWGSRAGGIAAIPASKKTVTVVNCVAFGCEQRLKDADGVLQTTVSNGDGTATCFTSCALDVTSAAFADYAHGDYTPAAGGALVDAGGSVVAPATDLAGNPRVYGVAIDIGCYEAQGGAPAPDAVDLTDEETHAGAVSVPYAWLTERGFDCSTPEKAKAAATQTGANGYTVWASYVADLVPTDPDSKLTATITVGADGAVTVDCTPKSAARVYRVLGKANLTDAAWTEKAAGHRFFKVSVSLPRR